MRITLDSQEIDQALVNYVRSQGLDVKANDIEITVTDGQLSASISTSALGVALKKPEAVCENKATKTTDDPADEPDREAMKAKLDELGVEYAPKARTSTLVELLEEHEGHVARQKTEPVEVPVAPQTEEVVSAEEPQENTGSLFGAGAAVPAGEKPPFDMDEPTAEVDDDKPLFGG